jgi:hypothetical protein
MDKEREDALDFVRRRALIPNRMYPTDRQAENQERAEESLADAILTFSKQYAAREGGVDELTIWWERNDGSRDIAVNKTTLTGAELLDLARDRGWLQPWQKILIEDLPNGTSRIIGQGELVHLHRYMKFSAIANDDND